LLCSIYLCFKCTVYLNVLEDASSEDGDADPYVAIGKLTGYF
jgi:hypothetical protein